MMCRIAFPLALTVLMLVPPRGAEAESTAQKYMEYLSNQSFKVRLQAAIQIGKKQIREAAPALIKALGDEHTAVRAAAAMSLGQLGHEAARKDLVQSLSSSDDLNIRAATKGLYLLDKAKGGPKYLVVVDEPTLGQGVAKSTARRLQRQIVSEIKKNAFVVLSSGEEKVLKGTGLEGHLKDRRLQGMILRPRVLALGAKEAGGSTTVSCKVSIMTVALLNNRMEFAGAGEADAEVEETGLDPDTLADVESQVLDASAEAAVSEVFGYLKRRRGP